METKSVTLHDGSTLDIYIQGSGPALLLPANPFPAEDEDIESLRGWGIDPQRGKAFLDGLSDVFRVVVFDYENHVLAHPMPLSLTPENIAKDFLAVADAVGANRFAYYGYSWLGLSGLQLAIRTDRLDALIMGGFPPIDGPYDEMLKVTRATYERAISPKVDTAPQAQQNDDEFDWGSTEMTLSGDQTRQFLTLYEALQNFDDRAVQDKVTCPKLCFAGTEDTITYDERWGDTVVRIADPLIHKRAELEANGWDIQVLEGMDHMKAMQPTNVIPVIKPWLQMTLLNR